MKYIKFILAAIALISTASSASADGKCGEQYGSCQKGFCCSKYGYCGKTSEYCGAGCNAKYGTCLQANQSNKQNKKTTTKKVVVKKTTVNKKTTVKKVTTTKKANNVKKTTTTKKANNVKKTTTTKKVNVKKTTTTIKVNNVKKTTTTKKVSNVKKITTTTTKKVNVKKTTTTKKANKQVNKISTNGRCGAQFGSCPSGQCCSQYGYCGVSSDHCGTGCQSSFGQCGVITGFKYYDSCVNKKHWALTFDDGPYKYDLDLLDFLKSKKVKATFFINGANVMDIKTNQAKKIIQRMNKDGHVIASHTWSHQDIAKISKKKLVSEMTQLENYIYKYIGKKPAFMRPPYGSGDGDREIAKTLSSLGYTAAILWNVDTMDWDNKGDVNYALSQFKKYQGKPILSLNHNYYGNISKKSLLNLIEKEINYMKSQGYTPVTMDKCLGIPAYQKN